jgi:hypothetical protein
LLSGAASSALLDVELEASAEPVPAALGSPAAVAVAAVESVDVPAESVAGVEPASVPELESAGGAESGAEDGGADVGGVSDGSVAETGGAALVVLPPVLVGEVVVVGAGEAGSGAGGVDEPPPAAGVPAPAEEPEELEPEVTAGVDVEVAPLEVAGVVDCEDGDAPVDVGVTVTGANVGVASGASGASGPAGRRDGCPDTEASSLSRVVGGAAAR